MYILWTRGLSILNEICVKNISLPNGETLGYRESGKGDKVLILIHGNMTSSKHCDLLMENLPEEYKVFAVDLRGFGISTYNKPIDSLEDFSKDLKLFIDALDLKKFYLAGWSTGGAVSMNFTADCPEHVIKLILIESSGVTGLPMYKYDENRKPIPGSLLKSREEIENETVKIGPMLDAYKKRDKKFLKGVWDKLIYNRNRPEEDRYQEYLEDMLTQRNLADVYYGLVSFNITNEKHGIYEGNSKVGKIEVPVLVVQGDRDYIVPPEEGIKTVQAIGTNAKLLMLHNSGHSPMVDSLDELLHSIVEFTSI